MAAYFYRQQIERGGGAKVARQIERKVLPFLLLLLRLQDRQLATCKAGGIVQIGRTRVRERVVMYGWIPGCSAALQTKKKRHV